jgi:L-threonylcarbamoyladenylate synthase
MAIISNYTASIIKDAALALKEGNLVAFPTETVYGLGADATNEKAVTRVYEVKGRPTTHPLIIHTSSIENLYKWASDIPEYALKLARNFWPGPLTLILPRTNLAKDFITGGQDYVGIRVPANKIALALLKEFELQGGKGVAAPSANRFGKVSPTCANDVREELSNYLKTNDLVLDGGPSVVGVESTIVNCSGNTPIVLRPGIITTSMLNELLDLQVEVNTNSLSNQIKVPGSLESHYSPNAKVYLSGTPAPGDGLIALSVYPTPAGVIRLISPRSNNDYARALYKGLRLADYKKLAKVFIIAPEGDDIAVAIRDRILKAASTA